MERDLLIYSLKAGGHDTNQFSSLETPEVVITTSDVSSDDKVGASILGF